MSWRTSPPVAEILKKRADALNLMTSGNYSFDRLIEIGGLLKKAVGIPLVANTRYISHHEGERLLEAGFAGA